VRESNRVAMQLPRTAGLDGTSIFVGKQGATRESAPAVFARLKTREEVWCELAGRVPSQVKLG